MHVSLKLNSIFFCKNEDSPQTALEIARCYKRVVSSKKGKIGLGHPDIFILMRLVKASKFCLAGKQQEGSWFTTEKKN